MVRKRIVVSPTDRVQLERIARSRRGERRIVERAQVVLAAADGISASEIAERAAGPRRERRADLRAAEDHLRESNRRVIHKHQVCE